MGCSLQQQSSTSLQQNPMVGAIVRLDWVNVHTPISPPHQFCSLLIFLDLVDTFAPWRALYSCSGISLHPALKTKQKHKQTNKTKQKHNKGTALTWLFRRIPLYYCSKLP